MFDLLNCTQPCGLNGQAV
ncbi:hypothetical protein F383_35767 [Gossypium arboreum]|uniref:Uncharacterized protein n=1 Tax=Gossypium arboreum TaxID=29729 RepID=A0A0B0PRP2_GOSAR|nr:hypothetical protein F383_35767 [Gossypium arboreum]